MKKIKLVYSLLFMTGFLFSNVGYSQTELVTSPITSPSAVTSPTTSTTSASFTKFEKFNALGTALSGLSEMDHGLIMEVKNPNLSITDGTVTVSFTSRDGRVSNSQAFDCMIKSKAVRGVTRYYQECANVKNPSAPKASIGLVGDIRLAPSCWNPSGYTCEDGKCTCKNFDDCESLSKIKACATPLIQNEDDSGGCDCIDEKCSPFN